MSTEIELKLQISAKAARKLREHPLLSGLTPQKLYLLNTYYDTPALELHARRIALRFRKKGEEWLLTVKTAEPASGGLALRSEWESAARPGEFDFSHVDDQALRDFLGLRRELLEPVFTTHFERHIWQISYGDSEIEMAVDKGSIDSRDRSLPICEIELELLSGKVDDLFVLARRLQEDLTLYPALASKAERGYRAYLDAPVKPWRAKPAGVHSGQTPVEAFRAIALGCLEHFQRNEEGLLAGSEPEFVHQARVALRRLRSAIRLFAPVLPDNFVQAYGRTWQTLATALGDARNWDVFIGETLPPIVTCFGNHRDARRLRNAADKRARAERHDIAELLSVREYPCLLLEFTAAVYALNDTHAVSLAEFAGERLSLHARRAQKLASRLPELDAAERHKMRIAFKRLRYALEFFAPLWPEKKLSPYLAALSGLQDELGRLNDHATAEILIDTAAGKNDPGIAHGWIAGRQQLLLENLPAAVGAWLEQKVPWQH